MADLEEDVQCSDFAWGFPRDSEEDFSALSSAKDGSLMRCYTLAEILQEPDEIEWVIKGFLVDGTYGQIAGLPKTLKSHVATVIAISVASGESLFGKFKVSKPGPVVFFVGEGGRNPWTRRIREVCKVMKVSPLNLDIQVSFDVVPIADSKFQRSLQRVLEEVHPRLVILDPYYAYHGGETRASDLHQEGALLNRLSAPCMEYGANLLVVNHMKKSGSGTTLAGITQAGSAEWSDSWILLSHRESPAVSEGSFKLHLEVASRQWGGTIWDLDIELGSYDGEVGTHSGDMSFCISQTTPSLSKAVGHSAMKERTSGAIVAVLTKRPWEMTKTQLKDSIGGSRRLFNEEMNQLIADGVVVQELRMRLENGTQKKRELLGLMATKAVEVTTEIQKE